MTHEHNEWTVESASKSEVKLPRPRWVRIVDETLYWVLLVIAILANLILSVALVPFLIAINVSIKFGIMIRLKFILNRCSSVITIISSK